MFRFTAAWKHVCVESGVPFVQDCLLPSRENGAMPSYLYLVQRARNNLGCPRQLVQGYTALSLSCDPVVQAASRPIASVTLTGSL